MKLFFIFQRSLGQKTAVLLAGLILLVIGLSACGGQSQSTPAVVPEEGGDSAIEQEQEVPAGQTVTGFDIDGWF